MADDLRIDDGVCHVLLAYDVGQSIDLDEAERRISASTRRETIRQPRKAPQSVELHPAPLRITQDLEPITIGRYTTGQSLQCVLYDFGAAAVVYQIALRGPFSSLLGLSEALYDNATLLADSRRYVERLLARLHPAILRPAISGLHEDYCVYEIRRVSPSAAPTEVIEANRPVIAQTLRSAPDALSPEEVEDALSCRISFGAADTAVVDWNAAILLDCEADDVRTVLEYANVQLLELRHLDRQLDDALERAYTVLSGKRWRPRWWTARRAADLSRIGQLQVDGAILFEGVNNALKLLGDQYLARVYKLASARLHVRDWEASTLRKLEVLDSIYAKIADRQAARRMETLEWIIILLIAASIAISLM